MKNYWSLNVSRAVSQVIMQVHKPKVEYKLALQEKPQGSILTYYYKTNNLTRINWLNTRLIIASNKIRHEIPFKTKRGKYTAIWKKSIKESKKAIYLFSPRFPPQFFYSLLHNFITFAPHSWIPSSSSLLFSLLLLLLLIFIVFPPPSPHFYCYRRWRRRTENNRNEKGIVVNVLG